MLIADDKLESLTLGESTHCWCGMQRLQQITNMTMVLEFKGKVAPQMYQISGSHRAGTFLTEIARKLFQTLGDIGGNDTLLLDVLRAPSHGLALARELITLQLHRSCQGDGAPVLTRSLQQDLRGSGEPTATLWRIHEGDEESGVEFAGLIEQGHGIHLLRHLLVSTSCQDDLLERPQLQLRVVIGKVDFVVERDLAFPPSYILMSSCADVQIDGFNI